MDTNIYPGVSEEAFSKFFVKCSCQLITTHRAFTHHECLLEVIDLTTDSDNQGGDTNEEQATEL